MCIRDSYYLVYLQVVFVICSLNPESLEIKLKCFVSFLSCEGRYDVDADILNMKLKGKGPFMGNGSKYFDLHRVLIEFSLHCAKAFRKINFPFFKSRFSLVEIPVFKQVFTCETCITSG